MTNPKDTGPLDWRIAIVGKDGRPTPEFQRRWTTQRDNNALIGTLTFGTGAPTGAPADGAEYVNISTTPYTLFLGNGGTWHQTGAATFTDLRDAPHVYAGSALKILRVKSTVDGVEFASQSAVLDSLGAVQGSILFRSASGWTTLGPGTSGNFLKTLGAGADPAWAVTSGGGTGGAAFHPGFRPGRLYGAPFAAATTQATLAANTLIAVPFYVPADTTFTKLQVAVGTAAAAGKTCRMGVYTNSNGAPNTLEYDLGTTSIAVTGFVGYSGAALPITAGWHWLVYISDGTPIVNVSAQVGISTYLIGATSGGGGVEILTAAFTYAALPATFPSITYVAGNPPMLYMTLGLSGAGPGGSSTRELLTANRTYFVRTDGSDANNGLINNAGGAFLTLQHAIDVVRNLDLGIFDVTIQVADGTYTGGLVVGGPWVGSGNVFLLGNVTTPANCILQVTGVCVTTKDGGKLNLAGFKFLATSGSALNASTGGSITVTGLVDFGTSTGSQHVLSRTNGYIEFATDYNVTGSASSHYFSDRGGVIFAKGRTVTVTGAPVFTFFAVAQSAAILDIDTCVFSGAATAQRYLAQINGVINTHGGGANYFPGSTVGATATGGQYN